MSKDFDICKPVGRKDVGRARRR